MAELEEQTEDAIFPPLPAPIGTKRRIQGEVLVVLALAFVPDLFNAILVFVQPSPGWSSFAMSSLALIIRSISVCAVVLYILRLSGDGMISVGLRRPHLIIDPIVGVIAFFSWYLLYQQTAFFFWNLGQIGAIPNSWIDIDASDRAMPVGVSGFLWLLAMSIANGFAEELVMRGYLITRLRHLLGSTSGAIAISTALFASYHVYQGAYGVFGAALFGGIMAVIFVMTNRLWPCVVAHVIADCAAYLWA